MNQPFDGVRPPKQNSLGIWTYEVGRRLAGAHEVLIYLGGGRYRFYGHRADGVEYRYVPQAIDHRLQRLHRLLARGTNPSRPGFASKWYYLSYGWAVARDLRRQQCDVAHILNFSQFVPMIRRLNPAIRIVLHMQCDWLSQLDPDLIERRLRQADLVLGCSEHVAREVRNAFPHLADRCRSLHNGVDMDHFRPRNGLPRRAADDHKRLLFVGRVSPEKGVHVLLDAFKKVHERFPTTRLDVVGAHAVPPPEFIVALSKDPIVADLVRFYDRGYLSHLRDRLSNGMAERVRFTENLPYHEVAERYRSADVFVCPSVWHEPFGMPNAEAMASGLPVVATRSGGISEIVEDGKTGLLVQRNDASGLANAVLTLLDNEPLRRSMGTAGRRRAEKCFSWERIAEDLLEQYRSLHGCRGQTPVS